MAELEDLNGKWLRALADLENYKRRTERERRFWTASAKEEVLLSLLDVVDDLERALSSEPDAGADGDVGFRDGIELIVQRLAEILRGHGVRPIDALGEEFDPTVHEAVAQVESNDHAADAVVEEMRKGYMIGDKLLRPARVVVAK